MKELEINLLDYQLRLLQSPAKYLGLIGGTGCGKTYFLPRWLLINMMNNPDNEWIISAPTIGMVKRNPVKYILKYFNEIELEYTYNKSEIIIENEFGIIYGISSTDSDRMQGIHAKGIIGDEAGLFPKQWWDVAVQRVSFTGGKILLTTTPYDPNHWLKLDFWDEWENGDKDYHIENPSSLQNPYYPESEYYKAKKRLPKWKFELLFEAKWPEDSEDKLFNTKDVIYAFKRQDYVPLNDGELVVSVDIAREGNDASVVCAWCDDNCLLIRKFYKIGGIELSNKVVEIGKELLQIVEQEFNLSKSIEDVNFIIDKGALTNVDEIIEDMGYDCYGVNFAENAYEKNKFHNVRAEMYYELSEKVRKHQIYLPLDGSKENEEIMDEMVEELSVTTHKYDAKARLKLRPKEEIKKEIGRSPDVSDAVALRYAMPKARVDILIV